MNDLKDTSKILIPKELNEVYPDKSLVYIDIETTGFSASYDQIVTVGILRFDTTWRLDQFWATTLFEEREMLIEILRLDLPDTLYICYNGKSFDIPFILKRLSYHNLPSLSIRHRVLDYIRLGRLLSKEKQLSSYSFKSLEQYYGLDRLNDIAGEEVIHAFQLYLSTSNPVHRNAILKHNELDVMNMPYMLSQLSELYGPELTHIIPIIFTIDTYTFALEIRYSNEQVLFNGHLSKSLQLPVEVMTGLEMRIHKDQVHIKLPVIKQLAGNHVFLRVDWNRCSNFTPTYEDLSLAEKTDLIFEIDGHLQTNAIILFLKRIVTPWIR